MSGETAAQRPEMEELLAVVPTVRFGRERKTHGYKLDIDGQRVVLRTRCGIDTTDTEYVVTHGVVSCDPCTQPAEEVDRD